MLRLSSTASTRGRVNPRSLQCAALNKTRGWRFQHHQHPDVWEYLYSSNIINMLMFGNYSYGSYSEKDPFTRIPSLAPKQPFTSCCLCSWVTCAAPSTSRVREVRNSGCPCSLLAMTMAWCCVTMAFLVSWTAEYAEWGWVSQSRTLDTTWPERRKVWKGSFFRKASKLENSVFFFEEKPTWPPPSGLTRVNYPKEQSSECPVLSSKNWARSTCFFCDQNKTFYKFM